MLWKALFAWSSWESNAKKGLLPALNGLTTVPIRVTASLHSDGSWGSETYILPSVILSIQSLLCFPHAYTTTCARTKHHFWFSSLFAGKKTLRDNKGCSNWPDCWPKLLGMRWNSVLLPLEANIWSSPHCTCHWHWDVWTQVTEIFGFATVVSGHFRL